MLQRGQHRVRGGGGGGGGGHGDPILPRVAWCRGTAAVRRPRGTRRRARHVGGPLHRAARAGRACASSPTPSCAAGSGPLRRRRDLPVQQHVDDVDAVLLSHLHHDHADLPSLRRARPRAGRHRPRQPALARQAHAGCRPTRPPTTWHPVGPGVEVLLVRADHEARPMPHRPNGATGMLLRGGGVVVWFAGDTSLHPDMALLPELAGAPVDLALLPVGGWGPRLSPRAHGAGRGRRRHAPAPGPGTSCRSTTARCTRRAGRRRGWTGPPTPVTGSSRCSRSGATPRRTCRRSAARS